MGNEKRYKIQNRWLIDTENNNKELYAIDSYIDEPIIDLLNSQDQQIADLRHKLKVAEKALKLACEELRVLNYITFDNADIDFEQQFKEQAEKEIKGE